MDFIRAKQVVKYGWIHAGKIVSENKGNGNVPGRFHIFLDILRCYKKYKMWSNQYFKEKFWALSSADRERIGEKYLSDGKTRDEWQKEFRETKKFFAKYGNPKYELPRLREKRNEAYTKMYHMGEKCFVEHSVEICRQHYLPGTIKIGNYVTLSKHVFIDYSGGVEFEDYVEIADGVHMLTHDHTFHHVAKTKYEEPEINMGHLKVCYGAMIGSRATVMSSCHYIGKFARIGAGAVVTKDVPDYAVVLGVPGKPVKYLEP